MEGLLGRLVTPRVFIHSKLQPSARRQVLLQPSPIPRTPCPELGWKGKSTEWGQLQPNRGSEFQSLQQEPGIFDLSLSFPLCLLRCS